MPTPITEHLLRHDCCIPSHYSRCCAMLRTLYGDSSLSHLIEKQSSHIFLSSFHIGTVGGCPTCGVIHSVCLSFRSSFHQRAHSILYISRSKLCCNRVASECVYDPSPRKNSGPSKDASPLSTIPKGTLNINLSLKLQSPDDYQILAAGSPYVDKCPNGFLGPTAYSAIFLEHQGKLGMDLLDPCESYNQH